MYVELPLCVHTRTTFDSFYILVEIVDCSMILNFHPFCQFLIYFITFAFFLLTSSLCFCQPFPLLFPLLFSSTSFPYLFFLDSNVPPNHPPFHTHPTHQPPECPPNNICPFVALSKQIKNLWPFTSSLVCLIFFLFSKKIGIIFKKESKFDIFFLIFGKKNLQIFNTKIEKPRTL